MTPSFDLNLLTLLAILSLLPAAAATDAGVVIGAVVGGAGLLVGVLIFVFLWVYVRPKLIDTREPSELKLSNKVSSSSEV